MTANEIQTLLENLLDEMSRRSRDPQDDDDDWKDEFDPDGELAECDVTTYEHGGYLTRDAGIVVRNADGSEFQITIVQTGYAKDDDDDDDETDPDHESGTCTACCRSNADCVCDE